MTSHAPSTNRGGTSASALRDRCRSLGLPVWRCDNTGLILAEPEEPGPLGLLLRAPTFCRAVSQAVSRWATASQAGVTEAFEGCWLIPVAEMHRRRRTGFTVLAALGPECVSSPAIAAACAEASVEPATTRRALAARARFSEHSAATTMQAISWMADDLTRLAEGEQTAATFTRQLTDAYETIDLLYSLGRSMNNLDNPDRFIARMCERVRFTLNFGWVAVWMLEDHRKGCAPTPARFFSSGDVTAPRPALLRAARRVLHSGEGGGSCVILTELDERPVGGAGQLLVQPVLCSGVPTAAIIAGDKGGDDPQVSSYEIQLLEAASGFIGAFMDNAALYADQQAMFMGTLVSLTSAIDAKDRYTCGHSQRVAHLAHELALAGGMERSLAERIRLAGLIHDVGKIGVPEAVLCKAGKLTDEEFAAIKKHPEIGHRILRDIPQMEDLLPGVLHHHERFDGRGYPHGLKGRDIPLPGRIIAIADTFDAMSSTRSYRAAMPRDKVLAELQRCAGAQFDPDLVPAFLRLDFSTYDRMVTEHAAGAEAAPPTAPPGELKKAA